MTQQTESMRLQQENKELRGEIQKLQKQAEQHTEMLDLLKLYYNATEEAIVIHDQGVLLDANDAFYQIFGYLPDELTDKDILPILFQENNQTQIQQRLEKDNLDPYETVAQHKDGSTLYLKITPRNLPWQGRLVRLGTIRDITTIKHAEQMQKSNLSLLENLERIDRIIRQSTDLNQLMRALLNEMLEIFGSDRAWLLFPCDPDSSSWSVPMECTVPEYPGAHAFGNKIPMEPTAAAAFRLARENSGPVCFDPRTKRPLPADSAALFNIRAQIIKAIYPRTGLPWALGMHQCSHARIWSEEDITLFNEIGRRIADGLSGLLAYNQLQENENKFKSLVANLPGIVFRCQNDADLTMNFISETVEKLTGYPASDFIDNCVRSFASIIHPDDRQAVEGKVQRGVAQQAPFELEYRLIDQQGEILWIYERGQGVLDQQGELLYLDGVIFDITEEKAAENEILQLRQLLADIVNSMPSALIGIDADNHINQWNFEAEQLTEIPVSIALGKKLDSVLPDLVTQLPDLKQAITAGKTIKEQRISWPLDEPIRSKEVTIFPLNNTESKGAVIRIDDIQDRLRMEEALVQSEKMLSIGTLAAGMAHEINNPLAGIMQNLQVASQRLSTDLAQNCELAEQLGTDISTINDYIQQRKVLTLIDSAIESSKRAAQIVENMLSFSRKSVSAKNSHSIVEVINQAIELAASDFSLKTQYDFRNIQIKHHSPAKLPDVPCDSSQIQQVLLNLFINGAHAMAAQHAQLPPAEQQNYQPRFDIRLRATKERLHLELSDNGIGMNAEISKRIFEPFFTTKEIGVGTGLGLAVSYFIITDYHRGAMSVESVPGLGTRFLIELPLDCS